MTCWRWQITISNFNMLKKTTMMNIESKILIIEQSILKQTEAIWIDDGQHVYFEKLGLLNKTIIPLLKCLKC